MAKQTIGIGASANDGTGDQLRIAFDKTNDNFDEIYLAGPVDTNIRVQGNTISSTDTDGNIEITPNGAGSTLIANPAFSGSMTLDDVTTTGNVTVGGILDAADLTPTGGTLTVTGQTILAGTTSVYDATQTNLAFEVDGGTQTVTANGSATINGSLSVWDGTGTTLVLEVDSGASAIAANGSLTVLGTLALRTSATPTSSFGAPGDLAGDIAWDADFIYVCVADYVGGTPIWKRTAIATW
jgi:hypothetical protein